MNNSYLDFCVKLIFPLQPDRTLSTTADIRGAKKAKDCVTVCLAVNVTGSERLKPLVIHKYKRPRCFGKSFNPNSLVWYYNNKKAWMCSDVRMVHYCNMCNLLLFIYRCSLIGQ